MHLENDTNVGNMTWQEADYPNIHYFVDGSEYNIGGHSVLVIGGAYSVDKWYRLARAGYSPFEADIADSKRTGWFKDECLTKDEMAAIYKQVQGKHFDFVFSHTCPISWEPTDLFLSSIDQSQVDKSMEYFLDEIKESVDWGCWCFAHFHADRIERPHVKQFYQNYENLEAI